MDKLSKEQRSLNMRAVKSSNSKIEVMLGKAMWAKGLRYRKNDKTVFGKPDFTFKKSKVAVFCDGEFWHGKDWEIKKHEHKSNVKFWHSKIERNIERDKEVNKRLLTDGWVVIRFWGREIEKDLAECVRKIEKLMKQKRYISINDFNNVEYKVKAIENCEIKRASFTHFLYNAKNGNSDTFKKGAVKYVHEYMGYMYPDISKSLKVAEDELQYLLFDYKVEAPFREPKLPKFKFIDLFAGIGGFRLALQNLGGSCVFSSEWDVNAKKTYEANFGEVPFGDITNANIKKLIPKDFDILCAGFPCQAFSIAGKRGGFEDTRGTLFFDVAEIIKKHQPKAFFLENVKGLRSHDKGKTLATILNVLREDLNYFVPEPQNVNAKDFGVPQNRERIFIAGFRKDLGVNTFKYPKPSRKEPCLSDILEEEEVSVKYYLSTQYLKTLIEHRARHESKGNGFGYEIIPDDGIANAVVCGGMGRERNLIYDDRLTNFTPITHIKGKVNRKGIRKMTPREWARLQGYPDKFKIVVSDAQAYKQFGNSVAVPAIQAMAKRILKSLDI